MRRLAVLTALTTVSLAISAPPPADAQSWGDRLKKKAEEAAKRKVEDRTEKRAGEAADKALDKAECAATDRACQEKAAAAAEGSASVTAAGSSATAGARASSGRVGEGAWLNYDFVPGTKPLFVEDFGKDNVGDFPRRLELLEGNMEVAEWQQQRFLRTTSWPARFVINLPEALPQQFTIELDATPGYNANYTELKFADGAPNVVRFRRYGGRGQGGIAKTGHTGVEAMGNTRAEVNEGQMMRVRIMGDGRYVKVYLDDTRVANVPNANLGRSQKIVIETPGHEETPVFLGNFSVMAGGKKLYDALTESGRVATQGIYFDTGSDRIRPESTPTLKEIGAMLSEHPDLRLTIEGHTDNVGNSVSNQELSQRRAAAVKAYLVAKHGIDSSRLSSAGLGDKKPAAPNTTPEGRQQNRRVELVKM
jgi:outer membrane protein OmpA-like peptidoglycan-associated protein